jgi:hypothetical protein
LRVASSPYKPSIAQQQYSLTNFVLLFVVFNGSHKCPRLYFQTLLPHPQKAHRMHSFFFDRPQAWKIYPRASRSKCSRGFVARASPSSDPNACNCKLRQVSFFFEP